MPLGIWQVDWPNANSQRSYPLHPSATKKDASGTLTLSDEVLVGLYLPIRLDSGVTAENVYLKQLTCYPGGVSLVLGYYNGSTNPDVATATVGIASHEEYAAYRLVGVGLLAGAVGRVQFGPARALRDLPVGQFNFLLAGGRLDSDCVRPLLKDVAGIVVVNGTDESPVLTGVIRLVAGGNNRLTWTETDEGADIRIDAISGEGLTTSCDCVGGSELAPCIRTLNGVAADNDSNIDLVGDDCVQITTATAALRLKDACSKPCCELEDLKVLEDGQKRMNTSLTTLQNYVTRLEGSVSRMVTTVLGSRLNDTPCPSEE